MHGVWDSRRRSLPTKTISSQATRLHSGKARSYEGKALNETVSLFHTPRTRHRQFPPPFQPKNKKGNPHKEQEKVKRGKNTGWNLKESKLVKLN